MTILTTQLIYVFRGTRNTFEPSWGKRKARIGDIFIARDADAKLTQFKAFQGIINLEQSLLPPKPARFQSFPALSGGWFCSWLSSWRK